MGDPGKDRALKRWHGYRMEENLVQSLKTYDDGQSPANARHESNTFKRVGQIYCNFVAIFAADKDLRSQRKPTSFIRSLTETWTPSQAALRTTHENHAFKDGLSFERVHKLQRNKYFDGLTRDAGFSRRRWRPSQVFICVFKCIPYRICVFYILKTFAPGIPRTYCLSTRQRGSPATHQTKTKKHKYIHPYRS